MHKIFGNYTTFTSPS